MLAHLMKQGGLKLVTVLAASFFEKLISIGSVHSLQDFKKHPWMAPLCEEKPVGDQWDVSPAAQSLSSAIF